MGDFFNRMAERALGFSSRVRPDFSAGPSTPVGSINWEVSEEPIADQTFRTDAVVRTMAQPETAVVEHPLQDEMQSDPPHAPTRVAKAESVEAVAPTQIGREGRPAPPSMIGTPELVVEQPQLRADTTNNSEMKSMPRVIEPQERETRAPVRHQVRAQSQASQDVFFTYTAEHPAVARKDVQPTIQVAIGRVEVRAVTQAAAPPRERPRERHMAVRVSLEEYLRQRNERRR